MRRLLLTLLATIVACVDPWIPCPSDCFCMKDGGIMCPSDNIRIKIETEWYQEKTLAALVCRRNASVNDFNYIPSINYGSKLSFSFAICPAPLVPYSVLLERMNITKLYNLSVFHFEEIPHLERKHFANLEDLQELSLMQNFKQDLRQDLFAELKQLRSLEIGSSRELLRQKHSQDVQHNLTWIELNMKLQLFEPEFFVNISKLWSDAAFIRTPKESLEIAILGDYILKYVNESLNRSASFLLNNSLLKDEKYRYLTTLPGRLFSAQNYLQKIYISMGLTELPADLFDGCSSITHINFEFNMLRTLPPRLLDGQVNLRELSLASNNLQSLDDRTFRKSKYLNVLRLSNNNLSVISSEIFSNLMDLKKLYLDQNSLHSIHTQAFKNLKFLERLELQHNRLKFSVGVFSDLHRLKTLSLHHNEIQYMWQVGFSYYLDELDLSYNKIQEIEKWDIIVLRGKRGVTVNLTNNQISFVVPAEGYNLSRSTLILDKNPFKCDCRLVDFRLHLHESLDYKVSDLRCAKPEKLQGKKVLEVVPYELVCPSQKDCPRSCVCNNRTIDSTLLIDCSNLNLVELPTIPMHIDNIELDLSRNSLKELPDLRLSNVSVLNVEGNELTKIEIENIPVKIKVLKLKGNQLRRIEDEVIELLNLQESLQELTLSSSEWVCDCNTLKFLDFIRSHDTQITDVKQIQCIENGRQLVYLGESDLCFDDNFVTVLSLTILATVGISIGIISLLYMQFNEELKVWLFSRGLCMWLTTDTDHDEDKIFDAFISYSHEDESLIVDYFVPELENGEFPYRLCVHVRDWMVGETIYDQIIRSIQESRRTIVIMSKNFLRSSWGKTEFREAHISALKEGRSRVILIMYEDIGDMKDLPEDFKAYTKTNTYLEWGDQWFWRKLRYALREPISLRRHVVERKGDSESFELHRIGTEENQR